MFRYLITCYAAGEESRMLSRLLTLFQRPKPDHAKDRLKEVLTLQKVVLDYQNDLIAELEGENALWRTECINDDTGVCPAIRPRKVRQE
jgi:hypothetical protein